MERHGMNVLTITLASREDVSRRALLKLMAGNGPMTVSTLAQLA